MTSPPRISRPGKATTSPAGRGAPVQPGEPVAHGEATAPKSRSLALTRISLGRPFRAESASYVFLLGVTLLMVVFGLIMVLSSSSVDSHIADNNFFAKFLRQGMYALIGVPLMLLVSRIPARFWKRWVWLLLLGAYGLQVLVIATPLGIKINGNRNWLQLGPLPALQPSEFIKVALVLWLGVFVAKKYSLMSNWRRFLLPALLITGAGIGLVTLGGDLGTTMIMVGTVLGALYFAGTPMKHLAASGLLVSVAAIAIALSRPNRVTRILSFLHPSTTDYMGSGWQIQNGYFALASGGVFGVGLGNSHTKWAWLPAADTDFIFAIIGEELGLIGAVFVLVLFVLLTIAFLRIIHASADPFARVTTAAIMIWIIGQGLVNIAVVLGLLPVLGVPLPLISSGGTALISSLVAIGIVLSFARVAPARKGEPAAVSTAAGRRTVRR